MPDAKEAAERVEDSVWLERAVRVGLVAYGVVHLLVGWLALQLALHDPSGAASQQGAMHELAQKSYGGLLLWAVGVGLFLLAGWQVIEAVAGHRNHDNPQRLLQRLFSAGRAVVYAALGYSALRTAVGSNASAPKDRLTARVMDLPFGQLLVGAIGVGIIAIGVGLAWQFVSRSFLDSLGYDATAGRWATPLIGVALVGFVAKGVAFALVGGLFVWAAYTYDPKKAGGLDAALHTLQGETLGSWLLGVIGVGIACFGLYCFAWARYANTAA